MVTSQVPSRFTVNRKVKEDTFDTSLSDAILYAGPFNHILQHAVADGICDAITMSGSDAPLRDTGSNRDWSRAKEVIERRDTVYFFITHSLGSRMLYNVLINLNGQN
jgi:hypothetical protein